MVVACWVMHGQYLCVFLRGETRVGRWMDGWCLDGAFDKVNRRARDSLTVASLLVAIEEVVCLLLGGPLIVKGEDDERRQQCGPDETPIINAKCLKKQVEIEN